MFTAVGNTLRCSVAVVVCFEVEDGIRYLVRSRGLGDVYKRQPRTSSRTARPSRARTPAKACARSSASRFQTPSSRDRPVSYTHLTLPTSDLV